MAQRPAQYEPGKVAGLHIGRYYAVSQHECKASRMVGDSIYCLHRHHELLEFLDSGANGIRYSFPQLEQVCLPAYVHHSRKARVLREHPGIFGIIY